MIDSNTKWDNIAWTVPAVRSDVKVSGVRYFAAICDAMASVDISNFIDAATVAPVLSNSTFESARLNN